MISKFVCFQPQLIDANLLSHTLLSYFTFYDLFILFSQHSFRSDSSCSAMRRANKSLRTRRNHRTRGSLQIRSKLSSYTLIFNLLNHPAAARRHCLLSALASWLADIQHSSHVAHFPGQAWCLAMLIALPTRLIKSCTYLLFHPWTEPIPNQIGIAAS